MPRDDRAQLKSIFLHVIELPHERRGSYLDDVCTGDDTLRRRVNALLAHDVAGTGSPLPDDATMALAAELMTEPPTDPLIGRHIGPYAIRERIGVGGMGNVYRAVRMEDFSVQVAIKLIRRGMDSEEILGRFRDEMQFQAALGRHANIAVMIDAGEMDDGSPYFVMEYVDGERIDAYCDRRQLSTSERLELFCEVCSAVQLAHQNTVIHRDLKPSNILVTSAGRPVLIDFGIAKLVGGRGGSVGAERTLPGGRVSTPEYASPEQISGERLTTSSDVYSLGVVLYELLTGRRPYRVWGLDMGEIANVICCEEPAKPSTVVGRSETVESSGRATTVKITPESVSQTREGQPHRLRRRLAGDVDNIVLKALRKESDARYTSVEQLAADIRRHLSGEPIRARPATLSYRAAKFVRRNKVGVVAASLILLSLVGGGITTAVGWQKAAAESRRASEANEKTDASLHLARQTIFDFMTEISHSKGLLAEAAGTQELRSRLFGKAASQFERIVRELDDTPEHRDELANAYYWLGYIQTDLGRRTKAVASYRRAIGLWEKLASDYPSRVDYQRRLAGCFNDLGLILGEYDIAERQVEGEQLLLRAIAMREEFLEGKNAEPDDSAALARGYINLGRRRRRLDRSEEATEFFAKAEEINRELHERHPVNAGYQFAVSQDYLNRGQTHITKDQHAKALAEFKNAAEKLRPLFETNPHRYRASYAHLLYHIAWMHRLIRQPDEALEAYGTTRELTLRLVEENQTVTAHRELLARVCNGIAAVYLDQQQFEPAVEPLELGLAIATQLVEDSPHVLPYQQQLLQYRNNLAIAYAEVGRVADAITQSEETVLGLENLVADHPTNEQRMFLASARNNLALRYRSTGRIDAAREVAERAIDEMQTLVDNNSETPRYRLMLGGACSNQGELIRGQGKAEDAIPWYHRAMETLETVKESMPNVPTVDQFLRNTRFGLGKAHEDMDMFGQALGHYDAALAYKDVPFQLDLHISKARTMARMGRHAEAIKQVDEILEANQDEPNVLFYAAPVLVIASEAVLADDSIEAAHRDQAATVLLDQCMQLLHKAQEMGHFRVAVNARTLQTSKDFDPLRHRQGFQELIATIAQ